MKKILSAITAVMILMFAAGCDASTENINETHENVDVVQNTQSTPTAEDENILQNENKEVSYKNLSVSFIDVGQGDSEFIELPNGQTMLIDAGNSGNEEKISSLIRNKGYNTIDYFVMTHPHADHIGSAAEIIKNFNINNIYMPKKAHTSKTFENVLDAIEQKGYGIKTAKAGVNLIDNNELSVKFIAPVSDNYDDLNNYSAVIRIEYKNNAFLFMGDAEVLSENEILSSDLKSLKADIIKIGHHGSSTSSSEKFIKEVSPKSAVISVGKDNSYSHPHTETLNLLNKMNISVYRTDECGTIEAVCDGENITIDKKASSTLPNAPPSTVNIVSDASRKVTNTAAPGTQSTASTEPTQKTVQTQNDTIETNSAPNNIQSSIAVENDTTQVVYKTETGECYHKDGCASLKKSKIQTTVAQAQSEGLRACKNCKPPQ